MARAYKKNRAARRSPYETFSYWYDVKTKTEAGKRKYLPKLSEEDFEKEYKLAKEAGLKNPAKKIAEGLRKIDYSFQKAYEEETGKKLKIEDYETTEARKQLFLDFAVAYDSFAIAKEEFEALY